MFDNVDYEAPCIKCGAILDDWQTKDGPLMLTTVQPDEVDNFYTDCHVCGEWNEINK